MSNIFGLLAEGNRRKQRRRIEKMKRDRVHRHHQEYLDKRKAEKDAIWLAKAQAEKAALKAAGRSTWWRTWLW